MYIDMDFFAYLILVLTAISVLGILGAWFDKK